ncbi:MAG: sulfatase-like hydrolase/transferase, partial [Lentimonas sp.]
MPDVITPHFHAVSLCLATAIAFAAPTTAHALDTNDNQVSDVWEALYPAAAAQLDADDDGDADSNRVEGLAWNDPTDPNEHLALNSFTVGATDVTFDWQQNHGLRYLIWTSSDLSSWLRAPDNYVGANDTQAHTETLATKAFFRLQTQRSLNSDTDALTNREEYELGTNPELWDTDGDKVPDDVEFTIGTNPLVSIDSDLDTLPDDWEQWCILHDLGDAYTDLTDIDASSDFDGDTITDIAEYALGTSPVEPIRNILFFMTEDQSPDLGVLGTVGLDTPNIDALATSGVNFTRTFALSPVCSPSKMALFTGTYPHENSAQRNVTNYGTNFPLVGDPSNLGLGGVHEDLPTLIEVLRDRGWYTAISSKSHVQPIRKFPYHEGFGANVSYPRTAADVTSYVNQTVANAGNRPFFLCLNVAAPHLPFRTIAINNGVWNPTGGLLGDGGVTNVDANTIVVPNSFPDVSAVRQDFADYYGAIEIIDGHYAAAKAALVANSIE